MKCVSYTRTLPWKNHQGELTIAEQNQRIAAYLAEHKELDLQKKYSDRKNDEKARAAFDQMTNDGVERKFDCIIVASMYYCGPDFPAARQAIKETLYVAGIDLIVLDEGLDTRTANRKEVEDYFEAKRCEMHAEIMFAWRRKQGAGFRLTNSVPFGYLRRNGESNMIKDEEVAPYLSEAFSRYASGQKIQCNADYFKEMYEKQVPEDKADEVYPLLFSTMRIDDIFVRYLMQYEILLGQVTKEHTQKEVTDYIKKVYNPANKDRQIGFQPTRKLGRTYKEDDLTYNRNLLGHADIEKVVSEEKIRQLSRSIMDVLWFSLWNKAK